MNVFVLNCGSSSIKFQLIDIENETAVAKGVVERIGANDAIIKYVPKDGKEHKEVEGLLS